MLDHRMETFLTLCETMNYRAASERLHITQPAVTQHIQYLEQVYGCRLFAYDGRSLRKTEQGMLLERYSRAMRYQEDQLRQALLPGPGRCYAVGATKTIGEYVIAGQVARFLAQPERRLSVVVDNTVGILARLDRGELDFALIEGGFDRAAYESRLYREEPFVGLCSAGHSFAGRTVPPDALWRETLLLREEGSGTRRILDQLLEQHSRSTDEFARVICVSSFGLLEKLTASGCGITFAYAAVGAGNDGLASFHVSGWDTVRAFNYVWLPGTGNEEAVALFDDCRR